MENGKWKITKKIFIELIIKFGLLETTINLYLYFVVCFDLKILVILKYIKWY